MADIEYTLTYYGGDNDHQAFTSQDIEWCGAVAKDNNSWFRTCEIKIMSNKKLQSLTANLNFTLMYFAYQYAMRFYYEITKNKIADTDIRYGVYSSSSSESNYNYYTNNHLKCFVYAPEDPEFTGESSDEESNRIWKNLYGDGKHYLTGIGEFTGKENHDMQNTKWKTKRDVQFLINDLPSNPNQENNKFIYYLYIYGFTPPNLTSYAWNIDSPGGYKDNIHGAIKFTNDTSFSGVESEPETRKIKILASWTGDIIYGNQNDIKDFHRLNRVLLELSKEEFGWKKFNYTTTIPTSKPTVGTPITFTTGNYGAPLKKIYDLCEGKSTTACQAVRDLGNPQQFFIIPKLDVYYDALKEMYSECFEEE